MIAGKVLLFGATSGVGLATARLLAQRGFALVLAGRDSHEIEAIAADLSIRYSVPTVAVFFDANSPLNEGIQDIILRDDLVGVIYCIGKLYDQKTPVELLPQAVTDVTNVNFTSCVTAMELFASKIDLNDEKFIVAISSVAGDRGRRSNYVYGASKSALSTYLEGLAHRFSDYPKVRVLNVCPGFIRTKMTQGMSLPTNLTASPDVVANKILAGLTSTSKRKIYVLWFWKWIMFTIKLLPWFVFRRLNL